MIRNSIVYLLLFYGTTARAQMDSTQMKGIFEKIQTEVASFKLDTSAAPDDKTTRAIIQLRELRGGFNINEAMQFKMQEEASKKGGIDSAMTRLQMEFTQGNAKRWLDNAAIHIYRDAFTYKEIKTLVKFYKSSAGQRFATQLPFIMVKTMMAAEKIKSGF